MNVIWYSLIIMIYNNIIFRVCATVGPFQVAVAEAKAKLRILSKELHGLGFT